MQQYEHWDLRNVEFEELQPADLSLSWSTLDKCLQVQEAVRLGQPLLEELAGALPEKDSRRICTWTHSNSTRDVMAVFCEESMRVDIVFLDSLEDEEDAQSGDDEDGTGSDSD